jgi:carbamoyltransferase
MVTLGICGRRRHAASAIAVDGRIVAAISEASITRVLHAGYREGGFPVASATECLRVAGLAPSDLEGIVSAERGALACDGSPSPVRPRGSHREAAETVSSGPAAADRRLVGAGFSRPITAGLGVIQSRPIVRIDRLLAHAWQAAALGAGPALVLVVDYAPSGMGTPGAALFAVRDGVPRCLRHLPGLAALATLLERAAHRLGWTLSSSTSVQDFLEPLAQGAVESEREPSPPWARASDGDAAVDEGILAAWLDGIESVVGHALTDVTSPHVRVQRARASAAARVLDEAAGLLGTLGGRWRETERVETILLAGAAFSSAGFNARLASRLGPGLLVVPVPEPEGCALGAALAAAGEARPSPLEALALGPTYSEAEVKAALENARLDYLYEPSWDRLLSRVSRLLSRGKLVAWFQGAAEFGPRSLGGRSVLCDPSDRYVRENANAFLKQREHHAALPVCVLEEHAPECLETAATSPWMSWRAAVRPAFRDHLRSAIDGDGQVTYQTVAPSPHRALADLLRVHRERTGVPALANLTLAGPGEPTACSPRDAIRTAYSSAVDALVLQRFVLMKDYWQMRADVD